MEKPGWKNLSWQGRWQRLGFAVVYWLIKVLIIWLINGVTILQNGYALFTGHPHPILQLIAQRLNRYLTEIIAFLTFTTEFRPFPFNRGQVIVMDDHYD